MKYLKTKSQYKASNVVLKLQTENQELSAFSYDWWKFLAVSEDGLVVFNNSTYSVSTSGHQSKVMFQLRELGIKIDVVLYNSLESLSNIDRCIETEIRNTQKDIENIQAEMKKPRTHKKKNLERASIIESKLARIEELKNKLNKKPDRLTLVKKTKDQAMREFARMIAGVK